MQSFTNRVTATGIIAVAVISFSAGCEAPSKRLNAPPQGHTEHAHKEMQAHYTPMVDSAMLADMTMSSVHFVPHQSELNANGIRRLQRFAEILRVYGGKLRYDGVQDDKDLAQGRMKRIEDYLVSAGLDNQQFQIDRGLAGGAGFNAREAIDIRQGSAFEGTVLYYSTETQSWLNVNQPAGSSATAGQAAGQAAS